MKNNNSQLRINIELNRICNLHCSFCPYPDLPKTDQQLDIELVKKVLLDIKNNIDYRIIYFHHMSEPFTYPALGELFDFCDANDINYGLTTNALLLPGKIDLISNRKIDQINFSYQATNEKLHRERGVSMPLDKYRELIVDSINKILANGYQGVFKIKILTTNKNSYFGNRKITNVESHEDLITEINKIYLLFYGYNLDEKQMKAIKDLNLNKHNKIEIKDRIYVEIFPFLNWGNFKQKVWPAIFGKCKCGAMKENYMIRSSGNVVPCGNDIYEQLSFGNIKKDNILDILNSKKANDLKKKLGYRAIKIDRCKQCLGDRSFVRNLKNNIGSLANKDIVSESYSIKI